MAYSTSSPPVLLIPAPMAAAAVSQVWAYTSADAIATVKASDYFSNGDALGMKVGDFIIVYDNNTPTVSTGWIKTVTAGGAASMSATVTTLSSA